MVSRLIFLFLIIITYNLRAQSIEWFYEKTDRTLNEYVQNGNVQYQALKADKINIDTILNSVSYFYSDVDSNEKKAVLINIYNLLVIKTVIENYPISSPMEVEGFFDNNKVYIENKELSLNQIENDILRKHFKDPRIHFALVCGAAGCPAIQKFAYRGNLIEKQLEQVTKNALNNDNFIRIDTVKHALEISEIFSWYKADFGGKTKNIRAFIDQYIPEDIIHYSISYYTYDWSLNEAKENSSNTNIINYTPSILLSKDQLEVQLFNNLYSQTSWFDENSKKQELGQRQSWNNLSTTINYGVSKTGNFNIGIDINLRRVKFGNPNSSPIDLLTPDNNSSSRTAITSFGPKIKFRLSKKIPRLSVQSAIWIPLKSNLENTPWLDWQRYTWWTQFFYDKPIGNNFQLFTEIDALIRVKSNFDNSSGDLVKFWMPASLFFSWFPTNKSTLYVQYQYAPEFTSFPDFYMQAGLGGKYQLLKFLQLELSYSNFFYGIRNGAGSTYNLGLRFIK